MLWNPHVSEARSKGWRRLSQHWVCAVCSLRWYHLCSPRLQLDAAGRPLPSRLASGMDNWMLLCIEDPLGWPWWIKKVQMTNKLKMVQKGSWHPYSRSWWATYAWQAPERSSTPLPLSAVSLGALSPCTKQKRPWDDARWYTASTTTLPRMPSHLAK